MHLCEPNPPNRFLPSDKVERKAILALEDGSLFYGWTSCGNGMVCGEIVFNTSPTGYQEVCTDPSYANQIVLFTTSHIGNVGVNGEDCESSRPWVKGIVAREVSKTSSCWRSEKSFIGFLRENNIAWMEGLDTRKLAKHIRKNGTKNACIMVGEIDANLAISLAKDHNQAEGAYKRQEPGFLDYICPTRNNFFPKILIYDFGIKTSIVSRLTRLGCFVTLVPYTMPAAEALAYNPDGIILSNGPGDPASIGKVIEGIRELIFSGLPVLGICLGCQLIALAAGGSTKKMKFGHHGTNHPVYDINKRKVFITSQNHNYVIDETALPSEFEVTHVSLFDGSVQGIRSKNYPVMGFQGHPEGSPGPQDIGELFEEFVGKVCLRDALRQLN